MRSTRALFANALLSVSIVLGALAAAAAPAAAPQSETYVAIRPSFSPNRLGARTEVTFSMHFSGGPEGVPLPVHRAVVQLPAGLGLKFPATLGCTAARVLKHGPKGCPPNSLVGKGHALVEVQFGAVPETEKASIEAFVGPLQNGEPTLVVFGEGITPLERRVAFTLKLVPDHRPYWAKLEGVIPPIPSIPLAPDASPVNFSLTVGIVRHAKPGSIGIFVPKNCPAGGFPWSAQFTYAGGSMSESEATSPCP